MTDKTVLATLPDKRSLVIIQEVPMQRQTILTTMTTLSKRCQCQWESDQEVAPELFEQAGRDERWVQAMKDEVNALKNRGV